MWFRALFSNLWFRAIISLVLIAACLYALYLLRHIVTPLLVSFIVAYIFNPVVDAAEKYRISRGLAVSLLLAVLLVIVVALPFLIVPNIVKESEKLIAAAGRDLQDRWLNILFEKLPVEQWMIQLGWVPEDKIKIEARANVVVGDANAANTPGTENKPEFSGVAPGIKPLDAGPPVEVRTTTAPDFDARAELAARLGEFIKNDAVRFIQTYLKELGDIGRTAGETAGALFTSLTQTLVQVMLLLGNVVLFTFVTFYLLKDYKTILRTTEELIPPRHRAYVTRLMLEVDQQLRAFLRGQFWVCCALALMYSVGLLIANTPFAIVLGLTGGALSFVPYLGLVVTAVPAVVLTVLQNGIDWHALAAILTFVIAQNIEGYIITPRVVGTRVGLGPVWIVMSLLVFGTLFGFVGLLLAVPTAAALKVFVLEALSRYKQSSFYLAEAPPTHSNP